MSNKENAERAQISKALFGDQYPPNVCFFDHPVPDEEATKSAGRPKFRESVYVMYIPTDPDLVVKDKWSCPMQERHKAEHPEEWARYLSKKSELVNRKPSISLIPGMTVAAHAELKALELYDCEDLASYQGDIHPWDGLREIAKQIMEISDGQLRAAEQAHAEQAEAAAAAAAAAEVPIPAHTIHEERSDLRPDSGGRELPGFGSGGGYVPTEPRAHSTPGIQREPEQEGETFRFTARVA